MDWNVIVSVQPEGYKAAKELLHEYGKIRKTDYFNVLVMQVDDIEDFLENLRTLYEMRTPQLQSIGRIVPVSDRFNFQTPGEFENRARNVASHWVDTLAGRHFYVRMHRRGFKGRLSSLEEERFLDEYILETLQQSGKAPAKVDFEAAERVIAVETIGQEAGMSLWTREQLEHYPFLKLK
jgi:tRNA(Ser,Leu) C12 N-acetylase TAN1